MRFDAEPCAAPGCKWAANYWWFGVGKRTGYCFGHAAQAERTSGHRERKYTP